MESPEVFADPTAVEPWRLGEAELVSVTGALTQHIVECEALRVRLVADLECQGAAKATGAASTASWLSGTTRMSPGAATGIVKLGQALAESPDTAEALAAGRISTAHAKVIVGFFAHLPDGVPAEALPECERYLLDAAATENPVELARRAAALRHLLEPVEGSVPDAENIELNEFHASTTLGGRGMVKADLDAETTEMLLTALSALSAPQPGADGTADRRSAGRRRADAFTELLRRYLNSGSPRSRATNARICRCSSTPPTSPVRTSPTSLPPRSRSRWLSQNRPLRSSTPLQSQCKPLSPSGRRRTAAPTKRCSALALAHRGGCPGSAPSPRPVPVGSPATVS